MKALENDVNVQKRGIVHINYNVRNPNHHNTNEKDNVGGGGSLIDSTFLELVTKLHLIQCVPFRFVSVHFCFNSPLLRQPMALIQKALSTKQRLRVRSHYGTCTIVSFPFHSFILLVPCCYFRSVCHFFALVSNAWNLLFPPPRMYRINATMIFLPCNNHNGICANS